MESLGKLVSSLSQAFEFNQATLSGSVDVIVVRQPDNTLKSTPFHARFGKFKVLKSMDKIVKIRVNGKEVSLTMKLGQAGEAFFQEEVKAGAGAGSRIEYTVQEKILLPDAGLGPKIDEIQGENSLAAVLALRATKSNIAMEIEMDTEEGVSPSLPLKQALKMSRHIHSAPPAGEKKEKTMKVKTLRPTSDQLQALNLKQGINTITYTVESSLQGTQTLTSHIYFWPHDANIIISDIDGTITKTDFMGHMMAYFGKDWSQPGIAPLFQNIRKNGYHILYLTSRAIGQAGQTKEFLQSVYQDGTMLPHGPMIMSPDRMLSSVKRELLFKRPEVF
jgi:phosphatidate phosphatase PAH1